MLPEWITKGRTAKDEERRRLSESRHRLTEKIVAAVLPAEVLGFLTMQPGPGPSGWSGKERGYRLGDDPSAYCEASIEPLDPLANGFWLILSFPVIAETWRRPGWAEEDDGKTTYTCAPFEQTELDELGDLISRETDATRYRGYRPAPNSLARLL